MKVLDFLKKYKNTILIIFYILMFLIYIIKPINFDTKIYLSAAYQADLIGGFPNNLFDVWEHKLIINRFIFYILFKITKLFVDVNNILVFETVVKAIYGIVSVVIIKLFSKSTKEFFEKYQINQEKVFFVLYTILIGAPIYFSLQTEITGILIILLAIVFVLKKKIKYKILASFLISTLFFLKGVTLLYSFIILIIMVLDKHTIKQIIHVILTSFIFLIVQFIIYCQIDSSFIIDMYLSTKYITESWGSYSLLEYIMYSMLDFYYLGIALIFLCINISIHIKTKNKKICLIEIMTWVILFLGVYIQKLRYIYQIGLMIPACLLSTMIIIYYYKNNKIKIGIFGKILIITYIIFISLVTIIVEYEIPIEIYKVTQENQIRLEELYEKNPDLKNEEVLYIGNGLSAYYLKSKSYSKYTTTVYLNNDNKVYLDSEYVKELKEKIKKYNGKYIIIDDVEWIYKNRLSDDIIKFVENNYHYEKTTGIRIYETNEELYSSIYVKD